MSNKQNPFGPPGAPGQLPPQADDPSPAQVIQPYPQPQGYAPHPGYAQQPVHPYPQQPPPQGYAQHPGYGPQPVYPTPAGYAPPGYPAPINIVVQNTNTLGAPIGGGLVRVANRNKGTAALLAIFFGGLGLHKFYLGRPVMGILYLVMCWSFLPMIAGFLEGVGYLLTSDHAFDMKYNARLS